MARRNKSKGGRDAVTSGTLPLRSVRPISVNPLGISYTPSPSTLSGAAAPFLYRPTVLSNDVTAQSTPSPGVASDAAGNRLYRAAPLSKIVSICEDRNIRREVLFARGFGGRNGMKTARHTPFSKVKCK